MTSLILFLSDLFKVLLSPLPYIAFIGNTLLALVVAGFFLMWCMKLVTVFGGNKDKIVHSPTEGTNPYYRTDLYSNKEVEE